MNEIKSEKIKLLQKDIVEHLDIKKSNYTSFALLESKKEISGFCKSLKKKIKDKDVYIEFVLIDKN